MRIVETRILRLYQSGRAVVHVHENGIEVAFAPRLETIIDISREDMDTFLIEELSIEIAEEMAG